MKRQTRKKKKKNKHALQWVKKKKGNRQLVYGYSVVAEYNSEYVCFPLFYGGSSYMLARQLS